MPLPLPPKAWLLGTTGVVFVVGCVGVWGGEEEGRVGTKVLRREVGVLLSKVRKSLMGDEITIRF